MKQILLALTYLILVAGRIFAGETNAPPLLTLADAEKIALENHPQVAAADYRALAAEEAVVEARSGFFPAANLYADAVGSDSENTRILAGGLNNPSVYDRAAGGLKISQLITDFGQTANLTASSQASARAENQNATATRESVLLQVNIFYFRELEAQAELQVAQQAFETRRLLLDQVSALATNKLKSELDVSFAQVALEEGRLLVQKAGNNVDAAMAELSTALGYHGQKQFRLQEQVSTITALTNDVSQYVETALNHRPELLSLRSQVDAATKFAQSERDARLPTVSAVGMAGDAPYRDDRLPENYMAGGVEMSMPLFAGGFYAARQHQAELKAQADDAVLRAAENNVIRDVRVAWLNLNNGTEQLNTTEKLVAEATEAFTLADARYRAGISSIIEYSQAQLSLVSAQLANVNAHYDVLIQEADLSFQTGTLL
jgi:outer membrane protein